MAQPRGRGRGGRTRRRQQQRQQEDEEEEEEEEEASIVDLAPYYSTPPPLGWDHTRAQALLKRARVEGVRRREREEDMEEEEAGGLHGDVLPGLCFEALRPFERRMAEERVRTCV